MEPDITLLPNDIPYSQWVDYVFDHPAQEPAWWWDHLVPGPSKHWDELAEPFRTLDHLTRLFEQPEGLIGRFTRAQIDQGLKYLVSGACSDYMSVLNHESLPWASRRRCFDAMVPLFTKLMAPVYQDDLGHRQVAEDPERPTFACYMWWDVITVWAGDDDPERDLICDAVLHIFERVLALKSEACRESALHGLGHWHLIIPGRTEPVVRRFLKRTDMSPALRAYAERAAVGGVQ